MRRKRRQARDKEVAHGMRRGVAQADRSFLSAPGSHHFFFTDFRFWSSAFAFRVPWVGHSHRPAHCLRQGHRSMRNWLLVWWFLVLGGHIDSLLSANAPHIRECATIDISHLHVITEFHIMVGAGAKWGAAHNILLKIPECIQWIANWTLTKCVPH